MGAVKGNLELVVRAVQFPRSWSFLSIAFSSEELSRCCCSARHDSQKNTSVTFTVKYTTFMVPSRDMSLESKGLKSTRHQ